MATRSRSSGRPWWQGRPRYARILFARLGARLMLTPALDRPTGSPDHVDEYDFAALAMLLYR